MKAAGAQQHRALRGLFLIPQHLLPDDFDAAARHPTAMAYRFHLSTDRGGCAIPHPYLMYHIAHAA